MSRRSQRLGSVIHRAVQQVLADGLADPRLDGAMVTVLGVKVDDAVTTATVQTSIMPEARAELAMHALRAAAPHIRRRAGDLVEVRRMPQLLFKLDRGMQKQSEALEALSRVRAEQESADNERPEELEKQHDS